MPQAAPFGSWRSPVSAAMVAAGGVRLGSTAIVGQDVYWVEGKPLEGGRSVARAPDGERRAPGAHARAIQRPHAGPRIRRRRVCRVWLERHLLELLDQRLYRVDGDGEPRPITAEPEVPAGDRYADGRVTPDGRLLICVRERHPADGSEAINELVALATDGSDVPRAIVSGNDFYSSPRISPDGRHLVWLTWNHPRMPWDGCELWQAELAADGSVRNARKRCRRRGGIHLSARVEPRRRAALRVRSQRLVEPVPRRGRSRRGAPAGADGG